MKRKKLTGWKRMAAFAMALTLTIGDGASVWAAVVPKTEITAQAEDATESVWTEAQTESEADSDSVKNDDEQIKESEAAESSEVSETTEKADVTETEETTEAEDNTETAEDTENNTETAGDTENTTEAAEDTENTTEAAEDTENGDDTESVETDTEKETEKESEKETEKETEEETEEGTEEEERAAIDKPSKVINVRGESSYYVLTTQSGRQMRYVYTDKSQNGVIVAGTPDERVDYKIVKRSSLWDKTVGLYKYGNDYYGQCGSTEIDGFVRLYYKAEAIIKGNTEQYKDAYGMYKVNGKTYLYMQRCDGTGYYYITQSDEVTEIGMCDSAEECQNLMNRYAVTDGGKVLYYNYNGHFYKQLSSVQKYDSKSKTYKYIVYAGRGYEISFEKSYVNISWNEITNDKATLKNKAGDLMKVGYEVICNGNTNVYGMSGLFLDASEGKLHAMTPSEHEVLPYVVLSQGQQVNVKVRAVYYHEVTDIRKTEYKNWDDNSRYIIESKQTKYVADMYGQWSDVYTYKNEALKQLSAVTGVKASVNGKKYRFPGIHRMVQIPTSCII